jgi:CMP-N-acetylneuraminic acid synthetase
MSKKVVAFIPIKLNNQRLPGKNLLPLDGRPMCDYIFRTIQETEGIDERYVFCSDESIRKYLPPDGDILFLSREKWLDGYEVKGLQIIESFVSGVDADIYVLTHVTSPFLKPVSLETAIRKVRDEGYDSAFSASERKAYFWFRGRPVNYSPDDIVTTQNVEPLYEENGGFYIFTKEVFTDLHRRIGLNPYIHVTDAFESIDVDEREDFEFAEVAAQYLKRKGKI